MVWTRIMSRLRGLFRGAGRKKEIRQQAPLNREILEEYLGQLAQEMNLRMLCEEGGIQSGRMLWVQEITVTEYSEQPVKDAGQKKSKAGRRKERQLLWR